jgi:hypothetical protein
VGGHPPSDELIELARADIGISVALLAASEGRAQLEEKQAAIQRRMRELQRELNRPASSLQRRKQFDRTAGPSPSERGDPATSVSVTSGSCRAMVGAYHGRVDPADMSSETNEPASVPDDESDGTADDSSPAELAVDEQERQEETGQESPS